VDSLARGYPGLPADMLDRLARRYGSNVPALLGDASAPLDLGDDLGGGLTAREVAYLKANEWAMTADDILWRRTKAALHMATRQEREAAAALVAKLL
jgi:glycerol-3-phosphate dehydrogenase